MNYYIYYGYKSCVGKCENIKCYFSQFSRNFPSPISRERLTCVTCFERIHAERATQHYGRECLLLSALWRVRMHQEKSISPRAQSLSQPSEPHSRRFFLRERRNIGPRISSIRRRRRSFACALTWMREREREQPTNGLITGCHNIIRPAARAALTVSHLFYQVSVRVLIQLLQLLSHWEEGKRPFLQVASQRSENNCSRQKSSIAHFFHTLNCLFNSILLSSYSVKLFLYDR